MVSRIVWSKVYAAESMSSYWPAYRAVETEVDEIKAKAGPGAGSVKQIKQLLEQHGYVYDGRTEVKVKIPLQGRRRMTEWIYYKDIQGQRLYVHVREDGTVRVG